MSAAGAIMVPMTTICSVPGCLNDAIRAAGRCAEHQRSKQRPGSTSQCRRRRARAIERDGGICWICGLPGADSADHVLRHRDGGGIQLDSSKAAHLL
jgi:5-methylcytosine-specific restriction endonuclease McrA